jgi:SSS family solute:Na+ symporter
MTHLRWPGVVVIAVYLTGVLILGFRFARRQTSTEEYFVARRAVPGWAMGLSLFATIITSITFIAYPGNGFAGNWAELVPGIMALVAFAIAGTVVIPFFRRKVRMSAFEYFEQRFGRGIRSYAALTFAAAHFSKMGFVIYLVALVVHSLTSWPLAAIIAGVGLATVAYTSVGGITAVIWADVCQVFILLAGLALSLGFLLFLPPGGPAASLRLAWSAHKFSLGTFSWNPAAKSVGVMAIYGLSWYLQRYTADQTIIQRYLVARSDRDAVRGVALGAMLCVPVWALFLGVGTLTWSYYRLTGETLPATLTKPDQAYPYFLSTHIPSVLAGVILAALFSAAMSGLSSDLNALAVVGVKDFYGRFRPQAADRQLLLAGKGFVALAGLLCTGAALLLARTQGAALPLWYLASSVLAGGLLGVFCLAYFTRRANSTGTGLGIAACLVFTLYAALTSGSDRLLDLGARNFAWNSLLIGAIGHVIVVAVGYPASLIFSGRSRAASPPAAHPCPPGR